MRLALNFLLVLFCGFASSALGQSGGEDGLLESLKDQAVRGERQAVARRIAERLEDPATSPKTRKALLSWAGELTEIFYTQAGLNDYERARGLVSRDPDLARDLLQRSLSSEPHHPKVLEEIISIHLKQGDDGGAKSSIAQLFAEYPFREHAQLYDLRLRLNGLEEASLQDHLNRPVLEASVKSLGRVALWAYRHGKILEAKDEAPSRAELKMEGLLESYLEWPEVIYASLFGETGLSDAERGQLAERFLTACAEEKKTSFSKSASPICQKLDQVKEFSAKHREGQES